MWWHLPPPTPRLPPSRGPARPCRLALHRWPGPVPAWSHRNTPGIKPSPPAPGAIPVRPWGYPRASLWGSARIAPGANGGRTGLVAEVLYTWDIPMALNCPCPESVTLDTRLLSRGRHGEKQAHDLDYGLGKT